MLKFALFDTLLFVSYDTVLFACSLFGTYIILVGATTRSAVTEDAKAIEDEDDNGIDQTKTAPSGKNVCVHSTFVHNYVFEIIEVCVCVMDREN